MIEIMDIVDELFFVDKIKLLHELEEKELKEK